MENSGRAKASFVVVSFPLDEDEHGICGESVWCEPVGAGLYRVGNVPMAAPGICLHDIIKAKDVDGCLTFVSVVLRGGHSTYGLVALDPARFDAFWRPLAALGVNGSADGPMVVDIPPRANIFEVRRAFRVGQMAGVWDCEEITCGHLAGLAQAS